MFDTNVDKDIDLPIEQLRKLTVNDLISLKLACASKEATEQAIMDAIMDGNDRSLNSIAEYIEYLIQADGTIYLIGSSENIKATWNEDLANETVGHNYGWSFDNGATLHRLMQDDDLHKLFIEELSLPEELRTISADEIYYLVGQDGVRVPNKIKFAYGTNNH